MGLLCALGKTEPLLEVMVARLWGPKTASNTVNGNACKLFVKHDAVCAGYTANAHKALTLQHDAPESMSREGWQPPG
jgi:hypothetical protein